MKTALLTIAMLVLVLTGCESRRSATSVHGPYSYEPGISTEAVDSRTTIGEPTDQLDLSWYRAAGSPEIALLVNRRLQGDDASWAASARFKSVTEYLAERRQSSGVIRDIGSVETRKLHGENYLPDNVAQLLQQELSSELLHQGYRLVDADVISRLAEATADRQRYQDQPTEARNIFADALGREAQWVIEVIGVPQSNYVTLQAKVVSLNDKRLLGVVSSSELEGLGALPGNLHQEADQIQLDQLVDHLVRMLTERLAATADR